MTEILRPCPFCGGEADLRQWKDGAWRVHCKWCPAYLTRLYGTEKEAVEGWNRRTERTCEWIWGEDWLESSPEGPRELHWANWYLDCGCWEGDEDEFCDFDDPEARPDSYWAFCPKCGAKVVE